jgi:hypothetical protein
MNRPRIGQEIIDAAERFRRCPRCGQMVDIESLDELAHHARQNHERMPGIPDDGSEQLRLDFNPPWMSIGAFGPLFVTPPGQMKPAKSARRGRRRRNPTLASR